MSDTLLRKLERRWKETGEPEAEVRYLQERLRAAGARADPEKAAARELPRLLRVFFVLLDAGHPVRLCLDLLVKENQCEPWGYVFSKLRNGVQDGAHLHTVMEEQFADVFPTHVRTACGPSPRAWPTGPSSRGLPL